MKFRLVRGWFPVLILKTPFIKRNYNLGPLTLIEEEDWDKPEILAHELEHAKQTSKYFGINGLLTVLSKSKRQHFEIQAYVAQIKASPEEKKEEALSSAAWQLSHYYNLDISYDEAYAMLVSELDNQPS